MRRRLTPELRARIRALRRKIRAKGKTLPKGI